MCSFVCQTTCIDYKVVELCSNTSSHKNAWFPSIGAVVLYNGVPGTGPIFLEQVECSVDDTELLNCPTDAPVGISSCAHNQDISIGCRGK